MCKFIILTIILSSTPIFANCNNQQSKKQCRLCCNQKREDCIISNTKDMITCLKSCRKIKLDKPTKDVDNGT